MKHVKPQLNTEGLKLSLLFAAYLIILFLLQNMAKSSLVIAIAYQVVVLCTPIAFYKITKYQVSISGANSFARILLHAINIYIFGALLLAGVQYIYYEYISPGEIQRLMEQSLDATLKMFPQLAEQSEQMDLIGLVNGAVFAMMVFHMNLFIGLFLSLIVSIIILRKIKSNPA